MAEYDPRVLTPGSAVARTLQDILARRRSEARQEMLDKLGLEEHQSTLGLRQAQIEAERDRIDIQRQAEERQQEFGEAQIQSDREQRYLDQLRTFGRPGMVPEEVGDPKLLEWMEGRGMFQGLPVQGPTETGEALPPVRAYPGTTEQQEVSRQQGLRGALAARMQDVSPENRTQIAGDFIEAGLNPPASLVEPQYPTEIRDWSSGRLLETVPGGRKVEFTQQAYTGRLAGFGPQWVNVIDPNTGRIVNQGQMSPQEIDQLEAKGFRVERQFAGTSPQLPHQIPATLLKSAQDAAARLAMAEEEEAGRRTIFGSSLPRQVLGAPAPRESTIAARRDFNMAVGSIFGSDPAEDIVKEAAIFVLVDPELSALPTSILIAHPKFMEEFEGISPKQVSDLDRLITFARGAFPANVSPPNPGAPR